MQKRRFVVSLIVPSLFLLSGCSSPDSEGQKKVVELEKSVAEVKKKAYDKGRVLDTKEATQVIQSLEKVAESVPPEAAARIKLMADTAKTYRADLEHFVSLGGATVKSIKSKQDLEKRIAALDKVTISAQQLNKVCQDNGADARDKRILNIEHEMLLKTREQLVFYKTHYGKWQIAPSGMVSYAVKPAELQSFNRSVRDIKALGNEQLKLLKEKNDAKLKSLKKED